MLTLGESWWKGYRSTLHYLYKFSVNLKLFPNKKLKRNAYKALGTVSRSRRLLKKVSYQHHDDNLIDSLQLCEAGVISSPMLQTWKLRPRDVTVLPKVTQLGSGRTQVQSSSAIHALNHSVP